MVLNSVVGAQVFGCVEFASVQCRYNAVPASVGYTEAFSTFSACAAQQQPPGYCRTQLMSAGFLANHDVCADGPPYDIAFHIRIPFIVHTAGVYTFRTHID